MFKWLADLFKVDRYKVGDRLVHVSHERKDAWEDKNFYTVLDIGNRSYKVKCECYRNKQLYVSYEDTIYFSDEWLYNKVNL